MVQGDFLDDSLNKIKKKKKRLKENHSVRGRYSSVPDWKQVC